MNSVHRRSVSLAPLPSHQVGGDLIEYATSAGCDLLAAEANPRFFLSYVAPDIQPAMGSTACTVPLLAFLFSHHPPRHTKIRWEDIVRNSGLSLGFGEGGGRGGCGRGELAGARFTDDIYRFSQGGEAREAATARCSKASGGQKNRGEITVEPSWQQSGLAAPHICTNANCHSRRGCKIHERSRRKRVNERAAEGRNEVHTLYLPINCQWPRNVCATRSIVSSFHCPNFPLAPRV